MIRLDMTCPFCGKGHDRHSPTDNSDAVPETGDVSLCIKCGELSIFDLEAGSLRKPTLDEAEDMEDSPEIEDVRAAWRMMKRTFNN